MGRLFRRILLVTTLAIVVTVALSAVAPGGMQLVARQACPDGTTDTFVVRRPHVPDPEQTVRTSFVVCMAADGTPKSAEPITVLTLLFAGSFLALLVASVPIGWLTRLRLPEPGPEGPPPPWLGVAAGTKGTSHFFRWFGLLMGTGFTAGAGVVAWLWLALDTPFTQEACGSGSDRGTCSNGEPVYRMLTGVFGAIALVCLASAAAAAWHVRRRTQLRHVLWKEGRRETGRVVGVGRTNTKINGARLYRYEVEVRPPDGSPPFTVTEVAPMTQGFSEGNEVAVLYDPVEPRRAIIAGRPERLVRQRDEAPPERGLV